MKVTIDNILKIRRNKEYIVNFHNEFVGEFTRVKNAYLVVTSIEYFRWLRYRLSKEVGFAYCEDGCVYHENEDIEYSQKDIDYFQLLFFFNSFVCVQAEKQNIQSFQDNPTNITEFNIKLLNRYYVISNWIDECGMKYVSVQKDIPPNHKIKKTSKFCNYVVLEPYEINIKS